MGNIVLHGGINPSLLEILEAQGDNRYVTLCSDGQSALQERMRNMRPKVPDIVLLAYRLQQVTHPELLYLRQESGSRKLLE